MKKRRFQTVSTKPPIQRITNKTSPCCILWAASNFNEHHVHFKGLPKKIAQKITCNVYFYLSPPKRVRFHQLQTVFEKKMDAFWMIIIMTFFRVRAILSMDDCYGNSCKCYRISISCYRRKLYNVPTFAWKDRHSVESVDLRGTGITTAPAWTRQRWPSLKVSLILKIRIIAFII